MSFSFFKPSKPKTPLEVVKSIRDSLMALDTKTVVDVKALEKVGIRIQFSAEICGVGVLHLGKSEEIDV